MDNFMAWNLVGFLIGLLTYLTYRRRDIGELFQTTTLGMLGSLLGGFVAHLVFNSGVINVNLTALFAAMLVSLSLLLVDATFSKR